MKKSFKAQIFDHFKSEKFSSIFEKKRDKAYEYGLEKNHAKIIILSDKEKEAKRNYCIKEMEYMKSKINNLWEVFTEKAYHVFLSQITVQILLFIIIVLLFCYAKSRDSSILILFTIVIGGLFLEIFPMTILFYKISGDLFGFTNAYNSMFDCYKKYGDIESQLDLLTNHSLNSQRKELRNTPTSKKEGSSS